MPDSVCDAITTYFKSRDAEFVRLMDELQQREETEAARREEKRLRAELADAKRRAEIAQREAAAAKTKWFKTINAFMAARKAMVVAKTAEVPRAVAEAKPISMPEPSAKGEIATSVSGVSRWFELINGLGAAKPALSAMETEVRRVDVAASSSKSASVTVSFGAVAVAAAPPSIEAPFIDVEEEERRLSVVDATIGSQARANEAVVAADVQAKLVALEAEKDVCAKEIDELKMRVKKEEIVKIQALNRVEELKLKAAEVS